MGWYIACLSNLPQNSQHLNVCIKTTHQFSVLFFCIEGFFNLQEESSRGKFQSIEKQINIENHNGLNVDGSLVATNCKTIALLAESD